MLTASQQVEICCIDAREPKTIKQNTMDLDARFSSGSARLLCIMVYDIFAIILNMGYDIIQTIPVIINTELRDDYFLSNELISLS